MRISTDPKDPNFVPGAATRFRVCSAGVEVKEWLIADNKRHYVIVATAPRRTNMAVPRPERKALRGHVTIGERHA